jgi:UDP-N-acetylglucosamine 2-epimerase (non-hydrolysing)
MIAVAYGTTGELIKLAPILHALERRGPLITLCTGQQVEQIPALLHDFGLRAPTVWLGRGRRGADLGRPGDIPLWLGAVARRFAGRRRWLKSALRAAPTRPLVLVHGDTFTTVLGGLMGRAVGAPVAHIEAGLRSGDWRNPFPEELDRRITSKLAGLHFAPGPWAAGNLRSGGVRGEIVDTGGNTIRDALELVDGLPPAVALPDEPFGLVSIHRFELLGKPAALREILELLRAASRATPLLFIDHPVTVAAVRQAGLEAMFDDRFVRVPRQRYFRFIALLKASAFLVTDSGGSQEECAQLGHPCLVHRAATERQDGLDGPVVLSRLDPGVVKRFLADPLAHRRPAAGGDRRPTDVIVDYLQLNGFCAAGPAPGR